MAFVPMARAADLTAPAVAVGPVVSSWTGFYAGVNFGYGFGAGGDNVGGQTYYENTSHDSFDTEWYGNGGPAWNFSSELSGVLGGVQVGYNVEVAPSIVVGAEADFQLSNMSGSGSGFDSTSIQLYPAFDPANPNNWSVEGTGSVNQNVDWFGTVRARFGTTVADNSLLLYGTGGLAYGRVSQTLSYAGGFPPDSSLGFIGSHWSGSATDAETKIGWTLGAGAEWLLPNLKNWSLKAEYLYTDLGSTTVDLTAPAYKNDGTGNRFVQASNTVDWQWQTVKVGLNYHF